MANKHTHNANKQQNNQMMIVITCSERTEKAEELRLTRLRDGLCHLQQSSHSLPQTPKQNTPPLNQWVLQIFFLFF